MVAEELVDRHCAARGVHVGAVGVDDREAGSVGGRMVILIVALALIAAAVIAASLWWPRDEKKRVRMHLVDPPGQSLPSVDGLLVSKRRGEYVIALPQLIGTVEGQPVSLDANLLAIPRERVVFYEVVST